MDSTTVMVTDASQETMTRVFSTPSLIVVILCLLLVLLGYGVYSCIMCFLRNRNSFLPLPASVAYSALVPKEISIQARR
ncbi:hypothetical protein RHVP.R13 [Cricetid gammaherpesvirus 2]|uniref:Uncharacterized protein n=1 Tax=Cricetid gammaherpesvirus 2 TaxID=1605972 RepID=E9M5L1_9GAMA|nr:hypothetical protein RHVP.R13 [Cricetid gammaherpesvirus 2]ADW24369.1 hypothetical protein RHVP.R13 [Cricetid gammaherpesvirus 2]ADW24451.1 hypothetical protein RHVP-L.R13 [Cricetid gammaherpesvirus 2]